MVERGKDSQWASFLWVWIPFIRASLWRPSFLPKPPRPNTTWTLDSLCGLGFNIGILRVADGRGVAWCYIRGRGQKWCPLLSSPMLPLTSQEVAPHFSRKKSQGYEMNKKSLTICRNKTFNKTNSLKQVTDIEVPVCRTVWKEEIIHENQINQLSSWPSESYNFTLGEMFFHQMNGHSLVPVFCLWPWASPYLLLIIFLLPSLLPLSNHHSFANMNFVGVGWVVSRL